MTVYGIYTWFKKLFGTPQFKKEKKVTPLKLCVQLFLIALNIFWMVHTYNLIKLDKEIQAANWDPYTALGIAQPKLMGDGFNSPQVKKAYRKLASTWHPDKVAANKTMADEERVGAKKKWLEIVRAYECLTDNEKYKNWI